MSDNHNVEIIKYLLAVVIGLVGVIFGVIMKNLNDFKKTIETLFNRVHENREKIGIIDSRCEERNHKKGEK